MKVLGLEHFANKIGQPGKAGDILGVLLPEDAVVQRGDLLVASKVGPQRATPASPAQIDAQTKQVRQSIQNSEGQSI